MNQLLTFAQWFLQGVMYFSIGLFYVATIILFCTIVLGTIKLIAWAVKKLLKKE